MSRALSDLFRIEGLGSLSLAGRTDPWILNHVAARHGLSLDAPAVARFRALYIEYLTEEIEKPAPHKRIMPGVRALLDRLVERDDVLIALLTGNYSEGARIKLEHFDLWRYFAWGAFGDDAPERNGLLSTAIARLSERGGPPIAASQTVVVGDTPFDVAVATAGGARSVAVATGSFDVQALSEAGADVVLEDLSDLPAVLRAVGLPRSAGPK
jgi:phosphoglycolate phosphatase-like HAD superfamily hydrolase